MSDAQTAPALVPGRSCDGCTMCCKLLTIEPLNKPAQTWCQHCQIGSGCKIYGERPQVCADFYCTYLTDATIGEVWKPANSRMVLSYYADAKRLVITCDATRSDAWRKEPYYSEIKRWSGVLNQRGDHIIVFQGSEAYRILPDRDVLLGTPQPGQLIVTQEARMAHGLVIDVFIADVDDPRIAGMEKPREGSSETLTTTSVLGRRE